MKVENFGRGKIMKKKMKRTNKGTLLCIDEPLEGSSSQGPELHALREC